MRFTCGVTYAGARMAAVLVTVLHLVVTAAKLCGPGGVRAVIAENLLLKQQLIVLRRPRQRAPNLTSTERVLCGLEAKHDRQSPGGGGPSWLSFIGHTTDSLWSVDLFRCESIVLQSYWVRVVMDQFTRRVTGLGVQRGSVDGSRLCRMFNDAVRGQGAPRHLSTDHDSLFEEHRWHAHLRVIEIDEIKTVPDVPMSHPFVERLIGTMRRDHVLFWNARDLERTLADFTTYYNGSRSHASLAGNTPLGIAAGPQPVHSAELDHVRWVSHCRGLVQLPMAA